jgi:DNA-binding response OmpR family regulator
MPDRILLVDHNVARLELYSTTLNHQGHEVIRATSSRDGLRAAYQSQPHLVLLDIMLPVMDGLKTCKQLREMSDVPVIMLSASASEDELVRSFDAGADDYIEPLCPLPVLARRIQALLRRTRACQQGAPAVYDDGTLRVDPVRQKASRNGRPVHLTATESRLLSSLLRGKGSVVPHQQLISEVWGPDYVDAMTSLAVYIRSVRDKLEVDPGRPTYILTKRGLGYSFAGNGHGLK